MATENKAANGGIGFFGLLTLIFITLKLTGFIHWSWVWVLAPFWGVLAVVAFVIAIGLIVVAATHRR
jgi:hypothetical protein